MFLVLLVAIHLRLSKNLQVATLIHEDMQYDIAFVLIVLEGCNSKQPEMIACNGAKHIARQIKYTCCRRLAMVV